MAVAPRPAGVLGVVDVDEVDASDDVEEPLGPGDQFLSGGMQMAGVEAEAQGDVEVLQRTPQSLDAREIARDGVGSASGVLDQDRNLGVEPGEGLTPPRSTE